MTIWKSAEGAPANDSETPGLDVDVEDIDSLYGLLLHLGGNDALFGISFERAGGRPDGKGHFQALVAAEATSAGALTRVLKAKFAEMGLVHYKCKSKALSGKLLHTPAGMLGYISKDGLGSHK